MDARLLFTIGTYVSGFFDFVVAIIVIVVAMTSVKRVDATSGYVVAGAMGLRFFAACCTRGVGQSVSLDASLEMVSGALSVVKPFFDLALWGAVAFAFVQMAKKTPAQS